MGKKLTVTNLFAALCTASVPDPDKINTFSKVEFTCWFESQPNDPDSRDSLEAKQRELGNYGFLEVVLKKVEFKGDMELEDIDGSTLTPVEFVKKNLIFTSAALLGFWHVLNRDVDAKNSKQSRGR
ncbi:MAG: hypothetical protein ABI843_09720 [Dokdonella sp.]